MKNDSKIENHSPNVYNFVFYTDGSGDITNKTWGCGYFGYYYLKTSEEVKADKSAIKKLNPTTLGLMSEELMQQDPNYYKFAKPVNALGVLTGFEVGYEPNTNNYAEALALYEVLKRVKDFKNQHVGPDDKIGSILIKSDSKMAIIVLHALVNNPNVDVKSYAYPELYADILKLVKEFKEDKTDIHMKHVFGHRGSKGNHIADRLANIGRERHLYNLNNPNDLKDSKFSLVNLEDFKKAASATTSIFKRYFVPANFEEEKLTYHVLEYDKDDEPGSRNGDIIHGAITETKHDSGIKSILDKIHSKPRTCNYYALELRNLKDIITELFLHALGSDIITDSNPQGAIRLMEDIDLGTPIRPGGLLVQLFDKEFNRDIVLSILKDHLNGKEIPSNYKITDITDKFFKLEPNKKGMATYNCILPPVPNDIKVKVTLGTTAEHILAFKSFLPARNFFKKLEGRFTDMSVYLITRLVHEGKKKDEDTFVYDNFVVILGKNNGESRTAETHLSIWNNFYSGKTISNKKKK